MSCHDGGIVQYVLQIELNLAGLKSLIETCEIYMPVELVCNQTATIFSSQHTNNPA